MHNASEHRIPNYCPPGGLQESGAGEVMNAQTREVFAREAAAMVASQRHIVWMATSRHEGPASASTEEDARQIRIAGADEVAGETSADPAIRGGRERGIILHKLIAETQTRETSEMEDNLADRAATPIGMAGFAVAAGPSEKMEPRELAGCVRPILSLPEVAELRPGLWREFPVDAATTADWEECVVSGIADAVAFNADGVPCAIVDGESVIAPTADVLEQHRAQVRACLKITGVNPNLIVLVKTEFVIRVGSESVFHTVWRCVPPLCGET